MPSFSTRNVDYVVNKRMAARFDPSMILRTPARVWSHQSVVLTKSNLKVLDLTTSKSTRQL